MTDAPKEMHELFSAITDLYRAAVSAGWADMFPNDMHAVRTALESYKRHHYPSE